VKLPTTGGMHLLGPLVDLFEQNKHITDFCIFVNVRVLGIVLYFLFVLVYKVALGAGPQPGRSRTHVS